MNHKRILTLVLVVSMLLTTAFAAGSATATVPVTLTVANEYRAVNVTVPASLPVCVINGTVIVADNARITNNSKSGSVQVTGISVTDGAYKVGSYDNFSGSKTIALKINSCVTKGSGKLDVSPAAFHVIEAGESQQLIYYANKPVLLIIGLSAVVAMLFGGISSCSMMAGSGVGSVFTSSYLSEDSDLLAAEEAYLAMEEELQTYLDTYQDTHDYDEYHFELDDIGHDPYVLLSILSVLHDGTFTIDEVQDDLEMLFDKQYILTETVTTETRYRRETYSWIDEDGNIHTDTYRVPYTYSICNVKLENYNLSHVPADTMDEETLSLYATYMATLGNREDLFADSDYVSLYITDPPEDYEIPSHYLSDERFAALIEEAEKYLGYPYVWGGSSPETSFDCSGFVSWVLTNSGLCSTGRLTAQGLYNISTPVSAAIVQPGDLVFFVGTYDTAEISHVGFYVGENEDGDPMFLHCGDPIQYSKLNTNCWQQHFYAYARPPYN